MDDAEESPTTPSGRSRKRTGTMNKAFKFPPGGGGGGGGGKGRTSPGLTITPPPPVPNVPPIIVVHEAKDSVDVRLREAMEGDARVERGEPARGREVEPPTPDLDAGGAAGVVRGAGGKEEDVDGGEIVEVDLS
jgi:hypothetical protein